MDAQWVVLSMSVAFLDIYMCKMEKDVVVPAKPIFNKCCVDDTYICRKKNINDELFQSLNSYHKDIKLTFEENPRKFLNTKIVRKNTISTKVFIKLTNFLITGVPKSQLIINVNRPS